MRYQVHYMRPDFFSDGILGLDWCKERGVLPKDVAGLAITHRHLKDQEASDLDDLFCRMQAENWSPNGEAHDLLRERGLSHTSMSVGDIAVTESGAIYFCDAFKWARIGA